LNEELEQHIYSPVDKEEVIRGLRDSVREQNRQIIGKAMDLEDAIEDQNRP